MKINLFKFKQDLHRLGLNMHSVGRMRTIHLRYLIGFKTKALVSIDWLDVDDAIVSIFYELSDVVNF